MCLFLNAMVAIIDLPLYPSIILPLLKCSEISKAQDRLTDLLQSIYTSHPQYRELLRMILSTVGRGGEGDVGQRIRDEILVIQVEILLIILYILYDFMWSHIRLSSFLGNIQSCLNSFWLVTEKL